jgi:predicted NodU family carbamoyl transferase
VIILGLNAYHADAAAAVVVDGKLVAAVEEERLRRVGRVGLMFTKTIDALRVCG